MKNGYEFSYVLKEQNGFMTFEVLSQPEKWRHNFLWYSLDGIRVDSYDHPAIYTNDSIFLRGRNKELDNFVDRADIQKEKFKMYRDALRSVQLMGEKGNLEGVVA